MSAVALRAFASFASRAPQVFRTIWSAIKASPALQAVGSAIIGQVINKGVQMID